MNEIEKINAELLEAWKKVEELEERKDELMRIGFKIPEKKHTCKMNCKNHNCKHKSK